MFLACALGSAGCSGRQDSRETNPKNLPAAVVRIESANSRSYPSTEEVPGTLQAKIHATLEAKVTGVITAIPVALGQKFKAGEILVRLDAPELHARLKQAESGLEEAERDWIRAETLFNQHTSTKAEYDTAQSRLSTARATVGEAKAMTSYTVVSAPFDGQVTAKIAQIGDLAAPGKPLLMIENPTILQLEVAVPQSMASKIHYDDRLNVLIDPEDVELLGTVTEIAPAADPISRTLQVKVDFPEHSGLKSGQFARLSVPLGERQWLRIPASALLQRGQLEIVFVVVDQRAQFRLVKTGKHVGGSVEILSGLQSGEAFVVDGAAQLIDGQAVLVK